jgi:hypothetical protein
MIIFGWTTKTLMLGMLVLICERCRHNAEHMAYQRRRWFTLFFVPIIPAHNRPEKICGACGYTSPYQPPFGR